MFDVVADDGTANVFRIFFVRELRRMHADHDQFLRILVFQELEVGQDVHAVDAAKRPEIDQHDLAAEILQLDGSRNVEPAVAAIEQVGRHVDPLWEGIGNAVMFGSRPSLGFRQLGECSLGAAQNGQTQNGQTQWGQKSGDKAEANGGVNRSGSQSVHRVRPSKSARTKAGCGSGLSEYRSSRGH